MYNIRVIVVSSVSMDERNGLGEHGNMEFCLRVQYTKMLVPDYQVISFAQAKSAALEFFLTGSRPANIKREEL